MASKTKFTTMDEYVATLPKNVQGILEKIRQTIRKAAPGAVETISYQIPTFKLNGKNLVHFAAWKNHIGFYALWQCGIQEGNFALQGGEGFHPVPA